MPPVAVTEFQDALAELAAKSGEATDKLLGRISRLSPAEARAFITDAYPALLDPFLKASGELTAQWYAEQPTVVKPAGSAVFVPEPVLSVPGRQLAISGRWALSMPNPAVAIRGNATRQVMNASRDTVIVNAEREGIRWIRQAKPDACGFCRMLATRAAIPISRSGKLTSYKSEGVFKDRKTGDYYLGVIGKRGNPRKGKQRGDKYHDHCRCTAVPLRDGRYDPPEYVQRWTDQYDELFMQYGSDPIEISRRMDAGRIRKDRVGPLQDGPDMFAAAAAENAAAPPTDTNADQPAPTSKPAPRDFDTVTAEFNAAIESGDDALVDQLASELEDIENADKKAAARRAKAAAKRDATEQAKWDRASELMNAGMRPDEAEAEAFGISIDKVRRRNFIAEARADGYQGAGFDELVTAKFRDMMMQQYWAAEAATNGFMVKQQYVLKVKFTELWTGTEARARKLMTPEMAEWFDQNGRITRAALRQSILDGNPVWRSALTEDFLR